MPQSIQGALSGLFAACQGIYTGVPNLEGGDIAVTYGPPGSDQPSSIVAVGMSIRQPVTRPTLGPARSREKFAELDVLIGTWVPGGYTAQRTATEGCMALVELLEAYFRVPGAETLGGGCMDAWVSFVDGPNPDVSTHPDTGAATGRYARATATVTARIRQ